MAERGALETVVAEIGRPSCRCGRRSIPRRRSSPSARARLEGRRHPAAAPDVGGDLDILFDALQRWSATASRGRVGERRGRGRRRDRIDLQDVVSTSRRSRTSSRASARSPLRRTPPSRPAERRRFQGEFPAQLVDHLVSRYLTCTTRDRLRVADARRREDRYTAPTGNRPAYVDYTLDFSDSRRCFEPGRPLEHAFGWGPTTSTSPTRVEDRRPATSLGADVCRHRAARDAAIRRRRRGTDQRPPPHRASLPEHARGSRADRRRAAPDAAAGRARRNPASR